jgi:hypothetical protein
MFSDKPGPRPAQSRSAKGITFCPVGFFYFKKLSNILSLDYDRAFLRLENHNHGLTTYNACVIVFAWLSPSWNLSPAMALAGYLAFIRYFLVRTGYWKLFD